MQLLYDLCISLLRKDKSKYLALFILSISSTIPVRLVHSVYFAGLTVCPLLNQSDLGRQLRQTLHILEN